MGSRSTLEINSNINGRPIVVLLGAGASKAACPVGDRHGRPVPVMNELIDAVGLRPMLEEQNISFDSPDFEAVYGDLAAAPANAGLIERIDQRVFEYFASLELPEQPTVYDHLLVSLRPKDYIITFNWDPLICQAIARIRWRAGAPKVLCLHGNVALAYCFCYNPFAIGCRGDRCPQCGGDLGPSSLLFPSLKDYESEPVRSLWAAARQKLRDAALFTVFGYSAPVSDAAAIDLVRSAWDNAAKRVIADTDVIDIKAMNPDSRKQLESQWEPFIHNQYANFMADFWTSRIARSPRRTVEAMIASQLDIEYLEECTLPNETDWDGFWEFYGPLIAREHE